MPDASLGIAIIGLGRMGIAHAAIIRHIPGARIAALVDRDKALGKMAASMGLRAPFYTNMAEAIAVEKPSVAYICTPTFTHQAIVEELAARGLDLFVEKPLGHTLEAATAMTRAAQGKDLITGVGYNLSAERTFAKARGLLAAGAIGAPVRYEASAYHGEVFKAREGWLFDPARSGGGAATNIGAHILYYVSSCFGFPVSVAAHCKKLHSLYVEDDARVELTHQYRPAFTPLSPSQVEGKIHICWSVPNKPILEFRARVEGEKGALSVSREGIRLTLKEKWNEWEAGERRIHAADVLSEAAYNFSPEYGGEGYYVESARFLKCCAQRRPYPVDFASGAAVDRVLRGIYTSSNAGGAVQTLAYE